MSLRMDAHLINRAHEITTAVQCLNADKELSGVHLPGSVVILRRESAQDYEEYDAYEKTLTNW